MLHESRKGVSRIFGNCDAVVEYFVEVGVIK